MDAIACRADLTTRTVYGIACQADCRARLVSDVVRQATLFSALMSLWKLYVQRYITVSQANGGIKVVYVAGSQV